MRRTIVIATAVALMLGVLGATAAQAQPPRPHAPIVITSDNSLRAVSSNGSTCGLSQACTVEDWDIHPPAGGTCISVTGGMSLTLPFVIQHNRCIGGRRGIVLEGTLRPGTVTNNGIAGLVGSAEHRDAIGIDIVGSSNLTIADNLLFNILGRPAIANGQDGGSAYGIRVRGAAPDPPSNEVSLTGNRIVLLIGGFGAPGGPRGESANGGAGGCACGISATGTGMGLSVVGNTISQLYGAFGGFGRFGGAFGNRAKGGDGGPGGDATGVCVQGYIDTQVVKNLISLLFPGFGAAAGVGGTGGNGGTGGAAGNAYGIVLDQVIAAPAASVLNAALSVAPVLRGAIAVATTSTPVPASSANDNTIHQLYGALGGIGGNGGIGGIGGNGGHGGNGVGIKKLTSPDVTTTGNAINFFFFGLGGVGGFPLGVNGGPGIAARIL